MTEKVKTVIGCYFLLPDFQSRGHPSRNRFCPVVSLNGLISLEKQNKMQLRFLKMLRENESKFQTLRVSVPRQIRENIWKNKKSKEMKLSMENEINIIFGVDPSSGLTMVKEVISTDVSSPWNIDF